MLSAANYFHRDSHLLCFSGRGEKQVRANGQLWPAEASSRGWRWDRAVTTTHDVTFHLFSSCQTYANCTCSTFCSDFKCPWTTEAVRYSSSLNWLGSTHWQWIKWMGIRIALNLLCTNWNEPEKIQSAKAKRGGENGWMNMKSNGDELIRLLSFIY